MRVCCVCGVQKFDSQFHIDKRKPLGLTYSCRDCGNKRTKKFYHSKPKERRKSEWLKYAYGITLEQYNEAFVFQNGKCAFCEKSSDDPKGLVVDHCHKTGTFRHLLCSPCNMAFGLLKESEKTISKMLDFLKKSPT